MMFLGPVPAERCGGGKRKPGDEVFKPVFKIGATTAS
jgi:hypothetical protein